MTTNLKRRTNPFSFTKKHLTTAALVVVLCFMAACSDIHPETASVSVNRNKLPRLVETQVTTLISDSGITRYRITTPIWYIYDRAANPYWYFPKGLVLQRFDEHYHVDGSIRCDSAHYYIGQQLWKLDGHVNAMNLQGETFTTSQLFWNERDQRIYSDSLIRVTQHNKIIIGVGFNSNQTLTQYTILNPEGIIPISPTTTEETQKKDSARQSTSKAAIRQKKT
jgi:LPS export ABC transporter protein LptC